MNQKAIEILGDYTEFFTLQAGRLQKLGIDIEGLEVSHLAFRTETLAEYLVVRQKLELLCSANVENSWNGRPISKLLLQEPLQLSRNATTSLIELIPPVHQSIYKMGLEHVAIVIGETLEDFAKLHAHHLTGQQYQTEYFQPYFITFPDHTNVKFYPYSLQQVCQIEGQRFDGFYHELN
ncbi:MAG TPA: VOC family protein [Anaerolineales bacterium]|nr:VOC family protein [Anaerolineales bacterium]